MWKTTKCRFKQISVDESENRTFNYASRESGILLPEYRLPTETEWEYAALALSEISEENMYRGKRNFHGMESTLVQVKERIKVINLQILKSEEEIGGELLDGLKQDQE